MTLTPGARLGPYRIVAPIGVGGFATVYRAVDDRFDTEVAVKVLADNHALDPEIRARFVDEARKLRKVRHPGVLQVHDIGETATGQPYLVLELAGGDLASRITGPADRPTLVNLVRWLGDVLAVVHDVGLVHRDVKPHNVLLLRTADGVERFVLADLGFAKDLELASGITVGGGTATFAAPEQRDSLGTVDRRADVYSASALVVWAATGAVAGAGRSWSELVATSALPGGVQTALVRGLDADRDRRQPTMQQWRADVLAGFGAPVEQPAARPPLRAIAAALGAAALLVVGIVIGVLVGGSDGNSTSRRLLDDGRAQWTATSGDSELVVVGPAQVTVDQSVTYRASGESGSDVLWIGPDGAAVTGSEIVITPRGEGTLRVHAVVGPPGVEPLIVSVEIDVTS